MPAAASERFLDAFAGVERLLRSRFGVDRNRGFYAVVDVAASQDPAVRAFELDLKEYADLRNAIVHERTDGHSIAKPHESVVERIAAILQRLSDPPRLGAMFATRVERAGADEMVGRAARP